MNAFFKAEGYWLGERDTMKGIVVGADEGELMTKALEYCGCEDVDTITFWFSEDCESDVIDIALIEDCPIFDNE